MCSWYNVRMGIEGLLDRDSPPAVSLCCVLEQDTLSAAQYWFNPGTTVPTLPKIVDWCIKHLSKHIKQRYINIPSIIKTAKVLMGYCLDAHANLDHSCLLNFMKFFFPISGLYLIKCCNVFIFQSGRPVLDDLFSDLRDGIHLLSLLEVLSGLSLVRIYWNTMDADRERSGSVVECVT